MTDWIPIALGRDIPAGATRAVLVEGREVVLWRGADGAAHAWEDRCPHRGMRLSFGFVRENALNCLYHGWEYGSGSQCRRIPAHPDLTVPPSIRANAYTSTEAGGIVWMCFDTKEQLPTLPALSPVVSLAVDADAEAIIASSGGVVIGPHLFTLPHACETLYVAWHLVQPGKTMLHGVITGDADIAAIQRVRALRRLGEQGVAA